MKKIIIGMVILSVALVGCAKKPAQPTEVVQARQLLIQGTVFLKQNDVAGAIKSFAAAIKAAPNYFESYYLLSETLIRLRQFTQAEAILIAAVRNFPDNAVAYYLLAIAHQGAGNPVPAIVAARKSVDISAMKGDTEGQQRAMILLATLVSDAKKRGEDQAMENAKAEAEKAAAVAAGSAEASLPEAVPSTTNP